MLTNYSNPPSGGSKVVKKFRCASEFGGAVPERLKILLDQAGGSPEAPAAILELWQAHVASRDDFYLGGTDTLASELAPAIEAARTSGDYGALFRTLAKHIQVVGLSVP